MKTKEEIIAEHEANLAKELETHQVELKYCHLPLFKHVCNMREPFVVIGNESARFNKEVLSLEQLSNILNELVPSNTTTDIKAAGKDTYTIDTPYFIETRSHVRGDHSAKITFQHDGIEIWAVFPVDILDSWTSHSSRKVTSSEHHYFGGISQRKIDEMRITCFPFIKYTEGVKSSQAYYGGDYKCVDANLANHIIDCIKNNWEDM